MHGQSSSLYFNDGERTIDFVLVWDSHNDTANQEASTRKRTVRLHYCLNNNSVEWVESSQSLRIAHHLSPCPRQIFEDNLVKEGLQLEYEEAQSNGLVFVKIHAPFKLLRTYAEILKLRMPMKDVS